VNVSLGAARQTRLETRVLRGEKGVARFVTDRRHSSTEVANLAERRGPVRRRVVALTEMTRAAGIAVSGGAAGFICRR
jgi:hypothetical protein